MHSPDARDEHVVDALLDGGALLEDPIRMAAVLDELRAHRPEPRPAAARRRRRAARGAARRGRGVAGAAAASARRRERARSRCCAIVVVGAISLRSGRMPRHQVDLQKASADVSRAMPLDATAEDSLPGRRVRGSGSSGLAPAAQRRRSSPRRPRAVCRTTRRGCGSGCPGRDTALAGHTARDQPDARLRRLRDALRRERAGRAVRHRRGRRAHPDRAASRTRSPASRASA